jgi:dTDP-4-amino-4,6-dideoxygalactose transaminase
LNAGFTSGFDLALMTHSYRIPFNRPTRTPQDCSYIQEALASGKLSGDGPFTHRCHELLQQALAVPKALLTTSCTHALEMAALLLDIGPGDEVIVPSFTFVSSVNPFVLRGARPVFADIRPDTLNVDERHLERLITPRTRAIVAMHYAGVGCEMDAIGELAKHAGAAVVEDNAHGLFGRYKGRNLGSFGSLAALSFHETKNLTCGEGGALLLNDVSMYARAEVVSEKGTDRSKFFRGEVDKYGWVDQGSSYLPSELLAAMLAAQLEGAAAVQTARRNLWNRYESELTEWAISSRILLPTVPAWCEQSFHMFYLLLPSEGSREGLVAHLKARGILAVSHYQPLHASTMGRALGGHPGDCPVTQRVAERILRLPFYTNMTDDEQETVIGALLAWR